jgi:glycosyltransferase involved in cell wall biosynthesis
MKLALELLGIVSVLELCLWLPGIWGLRKVWASVCLVLLASISGAIISVHPTVWSGLLLVISLYRIINLLRIAEGRMHEQYLRKATLRTSAVLICYQLVVLAIWWSANHWQLKVLFGREVLAGLQIAVAGILFVSTLRHLRTTRAPQLTDSYADRNLPSVTIAIPARNETVSLEACLRSIIGSTYPKLEILVLDDCSQDKTPEIIRSFAHDGVRFISGAEPQANWLAKNQAYQRLYEEANGEIIIFCGVDVRFELGSIRALVDTMLQKHKTMLSIIPGNQVPKTLLQSLSLLVQPMRYAWELALPRRLFNRPPVLSTCWAVKRTVLERGGSFAAVSRNISPQSYFARVSAQHDDGYSFLRSDNLMNIASTKGFSEQLDTAVRTRYPQVHRRPEQVLLIGLAELAFLCAPFGLLIVALVRGNWLLIALSAVSCALLEAFFTAIASLTYHRFLWRSIAAPPFAALCNFGLLNLSMWRYEFSEVVWKGRNVCLPVMHVIPHLPKI